MGISNFLSINRDGSKVEKIVELSKKKSKEEKRELELALLVPDKLPKFQLRTQAKNQDLSVKIFFHNIEEYNLFDKHFGISQYIEKSISNIAPILSVLQLLESGELKINKETKEIEIVKRGSKYFRRGASLG